MQKEELNELLTKAKELLKNEVTKISYETWIRDLDIDSFEGNNIVLVANNAFQKESILSRYNDLLKNTFNYITNKNCEITVVLKDDIVEDKSASALQNNLTATFSNSTLNPKYPFDSFVVGNNTDLHMLQLLLLQRHLELLITLYLYMVE